ncbi:hypothetical protein [Actinoalloteichus hymeniacidonis]|uniref:Uncharacterized protein n=1 Tax=Actinoalloteichus hymeniacidonis TaxID=340345 RepID=A0AAC9HRF8_9PSEU|nr:hypothetical protein [Actinoalloteichus hymeniacidonis]AOS64249.1 hypothetical protein TL08_17245 [Actinoalloteichus hymeniacidonis]MBB5907683.1 hypothetical protein [Actinoalloteichus hymeniacidonis]
MSRTDKTKPRFVRFREHNPRPVHDHRFGVCDLPTSPAREESDTRCRWVDFAIRVGCCQGCKIRSHIKERQEWIREANRRQRYAGRRTARRHAAEANFD